MGTRLALPAAALDGLAERGVRLRVRGGRLEVQVPEAARSERLDDWLARHCDELIALACARCGAVPYTHYTSAGEQRCDPCAPARCRGCYVQIARNATICTSCSSSPLVVRALARGAREAEP